MNDHNDNNKRSTPTPSNPADRERQLDDDFADLTDALLAGRPVKASDDLRELAAIARQLKTITDDTNVPSAAFRSRLSRRIDSEWKQSRQKNTPQVVAFFNSSNTRRYLAVAAAILLLVGVALLAGQGTTPPTTAGTAVGVLTPAFIVVAGLFVFVLIVLAVRRRP